MFKILLFIILFLPMHTFALIGGEETLLKSIFFIKNLQCSGVLISSNKILTAGHCLLKPDDVFSIERGRPIQIITQGHVFNIRVKYLHVHPQWERALSYLRDPNKAALDSEAVDLGIIVLQKNLPQDVVPVAEIAVESTATLKKQNSAWLTGAGCEHWSYPPSERHKEAMIELEPFQQFKWIIQSGDSSIGLCNGDSGSGIFDEGKNKLIGLNSAASREGPDEKIIGIATRLNEPSVFKWIQEILNTMSVDDVAAELHESIY